MRGMPTDRDCSMANTFFRPGFLVEATILNRLAIGDLFSKSAKDYEWHAALV
jgi:hypothetical protein